MAAPDPDPSPAGDGPLPFARAPRGVVALVVAAAAGTLLAASWLRWPDVNVDFGRELYGAWRVAEGDLPGRDLAWLNGPLSLGVNGGLFALFGPSLHLLVAVNLAVAAGVAGLALRLYGRGSDRGLAAVQALVFLGVFAFGQSAPVGNYCFPTPYSHELTHGLLLALLALERARAYARDPDGRGARLRLAASGLCAGLVLLTKVEVALALVPAVALLLALGTGRASGGGRRRPRRAGAWLALAALPALLAWAALTPALGAPGAGRVVLGGWVHAGDARVTDLPFYRQMLGLDRPAENLRLAVERGAAYALALAGLVGLGLALARLGAGSGTGARAGTGASPGRPRSSAAAVLAGVLGATLSAWALSRGSFWHLARPLPLFLLVAEAGHLRRYLRARRAGDAAGVRASAAHLGAGVFALGLLARTGLAPTTVFYGFALALPATTEVVALLVHDLPRSLGRSLGRWRERRGAGAAAGPGPDLAGVRAALAGGVLAFAGVHVARSATFWASKDVVVGTGADRFRAADRAPEVVAAIEHLARTSDPGGTLLVLPEGALVNYLLRRRSPAPRVNFMPPEMILWGEAPLLERLRADPPDRVLLIHKDTREYGRGAFGRGYAVELMAWVREHYEREALFGALPLVTSAYGVAVLRPRAER